MVSLRDEAKAYEPKQTLNIADLEYFSVELDLQNGKGMTKEGKEFTYKYTLIDEKEYRVAGSIIGGVKAILEKLPETTYFSVIKQGEGQNTRYQVIPYALKTTIPEQTLSVEDQENGIKV